MPNSRVRPLTEKPRTPAIPTTEMSSATVAESTKTTALSESGVRLGTDVLESSRTLDGLIGSDCLDGLDDRRHQRVGIAFRANEEPPSPSFLVDGL